MDPRNEPGHPGAATCVTPWLPLEYARFAVFIDICGWTPVHALAPIPEQRQRTRWPPRTPLVGSR